MKLFEKVIKASFAAHMKVYGKADLWDVGYHVDCWSMAVEAFDKGSSDDFNKLYKELRGRWQVFRSKNFDPMSAEDLWGRLANLDPDVRKMRLGELKEEDLERVWKTLCFMKGIKTNSDGPSVVAISKFLHFWNPGLFVIVDDGVVWNYVLNHKWLWDQIKEEKAALKKKELAGDLFETRLGYYLAILSWGADVVRENPFMVEEFARCVKGLAPNDLSLDQYDAAALEWLLLGIVEVPPEGVDQLPGGWGDLGKGCREMVLG